MVITENILFWSALLLYLTGFLFFLFAVVLKKENFLVPGVCIVFFGFLLHTVFTIIRWIISRTPPFITLYELISNGSWFAVLVFLLVQGRFKKLRAMGVAVMPIVFLLMGFAITTPTVPKPLTPALKSIWLVIHILFAQLGYGCYIGGTGVGIMYLLRGKIGFSVKSNLDFLSYRLILIGFVCHAIMIVSGAIWANYAWGRYWGWDPIETWSLISWIIYAIYIHIRLFLGWKGKRAAFFLIFAMVVLIFTFWGVPYFVKSVHTYLKI